MDRVTGLDYEQVVFFESQDGREGFFIALEGGAILGIPIKKNGSEKIPLSFRTDGTPITQYEDLEPVLQLEILNKGFKISGYDFKVFYKTHGKFGTSILHIASSSVDGSQEVVFPTNKFDNDGPNSLTSVVVLKNGVVFVVYKHYYSNNNQIGGPYIVIESYKDFSTFAIEYRNRKNNALINSIQERID